MDDPAGFNAVNIFPNTPTLPSVISLLATATRHTPVSVLFGSMLGGTEEARSFPSPDVAIYRDEDGSYGLRSSINIMLQERLENCAGLTITALNNQLIDDYGFDPEHISITAPTAALQQVDLELTALISLLYTNRDRSSRRFPNWDDAKEYYDYSITALIIGILHLSRVVVSSITRRGHSVCNPGAGVGMPKEEFLEMVGEADELTNQISAYIDAFVNDRRLLRRFDTACGRIFSGRGFTEIITIESSDGKVGLVPRSTGDEDYLPRTKRIHIGAHRLCQYLGCVKF
ncbi:hypothetical protein R3P38DRAFT_2544800 [Favolaschia claudopus]|uniref:Uncharacterized protein n=1 Tax=Favolaschia claudopus TaxID=2862362 RepID=A0AAW0ALP7_9AGAR